MTIVFAIIFIVLIIALITVIGFLKIQTKKEMAEKTSQSVKELLDKKEFVTKKIYYVNKSLIIAVNEKYTNLAVIENFNPDEPEKCNYFTIGASFIVQLEKLPTAINISYIKQGNKENLSIFPKTKEISELLHRIVKNAGVKKLCEKYMIKSFPINAASDWNCSYIWAFLPIRAIFAYYKTTEKQAIYKLNLLKEFFTIDVKYNYLEAPVLGVAQQLEVYEQSFLNELFSSLYQTIKQKFTTISENKIYFDSYNDIIYLTNGMYSLQSVLIEKIEDVYYKSDRLTFSLWNEEKVINFLADKEFIEEFENFVTTYNLRKIATNFDYKSDKLINTTSSTKFIIDTSRRRVVYCGGVNSFSKFTYMSIMFNNLESAKVENNGESHFVRIHTKDRDIIDVSCNKASVAQYILAQINTIIYG